MPGRSAAAGAERPRRPHRAASRRRSDRGGAFARTVLGVAVLALALVGWTPAAPAAPAPVAADRSVAPTSSLVLGDPGGGGPCPAVSCALTSEPLSPLEDPSVRGSTPTNWYIANWSGEGAIAQDPADPDHLVAAGVDHSWSDFRGSTPYYTVSLAGIFSSWDGGRTWTDIPAPAIPQFYNNSSADCGHTHIGDTSVSFGPNHTVYFVDILTLLETGHGCHLPYSRASIFSITSLDNGRTWQTPVELTGGRAGDLYDKPWIVADPVSGVVYAGYSDAKNSWEVFLQHSTDQGATWSSPLLVSSPGTNWGLEIVVDGAGGVDAAWQEQNSTNLEFVRSTDHGVTFTAPVAITAVTMPAGPADAPDNFRLAIYPALAVLPSTNRSAPGTFFAAYEDGTGGVAGSPVIRLARSSDNGTTWSSTGPIESDGSTENFEPSVAVGSDGTVYVIWIAENATSGKYRMAAAASHDGGWTFDRQINVSDVDSLPSTPATGIDWWIGDYTHMAGSPLGARPIWTDARSRAGFLCTTCIYNGVEYNISLYTAQLVNGSISASVPVDVTLGGTVPGTGPLPLTSATTPLDWLEGGNYTLTAPPSVLSNGSTRAFSYWYGHTHTNPLLFANSSTLNGTVVGGERLTACYAATPDGLCAGEGAPGLLGVSVSPSSASVQLDGQPLSVGASTAWVPRLPGSYWVNATAPGFYSQNLSVVVASGARTYVNVTLLAPPGTLIGTVSPASALVHVDGAAVPVLPGGDFTLSLSPGLHSVTATAPGYSPYRNDAVRVATSSPTYLTIVLAGLPGWINGTVTPAFAQVSVGTSYVAVDALGAFTLPLPPGVYWVNGSAVGYRATSSGPLSLPPLGAVRVDLVLPLDHGLLSGSVDPPEAAVSVDGAAVPVAAGRFSAALLPGPHEVAAGSSGFVPDDRTVDVVAGATTALDLVLNVSPGWITGTVAPGGAEVTVDGRPTTLGPDGLLNLTVAAGTRLMEVTAPGFSAALLPVVVSAGHATPVHVVLTPVGSPPTPWTISALPWALGAVAAVALAVLLLRRRRGRPPPV